MKRILLSVNPEHVCKILDGTKKYELRKVKCRENISEIVIYSTHPVMKVVATVSVKGVIVDVPEKIWKIVENEAGIDKEFFDEYYKKSDYAVAYALGEVKRFDKPRSLSEYGLKHPPQSFVYLQ